MERHLISVGRVSRGRGALKGAGTLYGTRVTCSCGTLDQAINQAPSAGGRAAAKRVFDHHVAAVTPERDVEILRNRIARAGRDLASGADFLSPGGLDMHVLHLGELVVMLREADAEMRTEAAAK